jgi:hypothetical protein
MQRRKDYRVGFERSINEICILLRMAIRALKSRISCCEWASGRIKYRPAALDPDAPPNTNRGRPVFPSRKHLKVQVEKICAMV